MRIFGKCSPAKKLAALFRNHQFGKFLMVMASGGLGKRAPLGEILSYIFFPACQGLVRDCCAGKFSQNTIFPCMKGLSERLLCGDIFSKYNFSLYERA